MFRAGLSLVVLSAAALSPAAAPLWAGDGLWAIESRQELRCGVRNDSNADLASDIPSGRLGFEIDLCRSWSAALFGNADQVSFVGVTPETGLDALKAGEIDVLALHEDALFGRRDVSFAEIAFVDSLSLMVRRADAMVNALALDGDSLCLSGGEDAERRIEAFASRNQMTLKLRKTASPNEGFTGLREGTCAALAAERLVLARLRSQEENAATRYEVLPEMLSRTFLGPVILSGDRAWENVIRWSLFAMILAEEKQVSSQNLASMASSAEDPAVRRLLGFEGDFGSQLGLEALWAYRILETVGNYGELYDRHFGPGSPAELERGPNALWLDGGLMRAPPFQ